MATIAELNNGRKSTIIESKLDDNQQHFTASADKEFGPFYMVSKQHFDNMQAVVEAARTLVASESINDYNVALEALKAALAALGERASDGKQIRSGV